MFDEDLEMPLSQEQTCLVLLRAFEGCKIAVRHTATDGTITFKATQAFLKAMKLEAGDMVAVRRWKPSR